MGMGEAAIGQCAPGEIHVEQFIHRQNLDHYRRLLAAQDQKDDVRRQTILKLLADEMSKTPLPRLGPRVQTQLSQYATRAAR